MNRFKNIGAVSFVCCLLAAVLAGCGQPPAATPPVGPPGPYSGGLAGKKSSDTYEVEITDAHPKSLALSDTLVDDRLDDKQPEFDPELIDSRPLEGWQANSSAAVVRLDVPMVRPDRDAGLLRLYPTYAMALPRGRHGALVSVNMASGKAKQFDDGLYAALDQAYYRGLAPRLPAHVQLVRRLFDKLPKDSPAAPLLAAALQLAGEEAEVVDTATRDRLLADFAADTVASKPISFYTWNDTLQRCWKFLRFLQQPLPPTLPPAVALRAALAGDEALLADYRQAMQFYQRLTNPYSRRSFADLIDGVPASDPRREAVSLFPPSTSREAELFNRLFENGLPPNADLMRELVRRIKSGEVDLTPRENAGWYDHQVFALETFLLPERGSERHKLLLSKEYKQRMLEAFKALLTTRRETHVRQLETPGVTSAEPPLKPPTRVSPQLRVEPAPTFYLRTARAYNFLQTFLTASIGEEGLAELHGLRASGERTENLGAELTAIRELFYGLFLVSCEDIGLKPETLEGEIADASACRQQAISWLDKVWDDEDLAVDARVAIPIFQDQFDRHVTRLWIVLGVRLTRLNASYARPPSIRDPGQADSQWKEVPTHDLAPAEHLLAVDEFAEIELPGNISLSREQLRTILNQASDRESALRLLSEQTGEK